MNHYSFVNWSEDIFGESDDIFCDDQWHVNCSEMLFWHDDQQNLFNACIMQGPKWLSQWIEEYKYGD